MRAGDDVAEELSGLESSDLGLDQRLSCLWWCCGVLMQLETDKIGPPFIPVSVQLGRALLLRP